MAANLKDPALAPVTEALLRRADVVHHNLRPGAAERLGLDDDSVRTVNPDIVYLHAPGWGSTGPFALRQSFAPMLSGYAGVTYEIAGQFNPPLPPSANEDPGNGMLGAIAILLALLHRDRTGCRTVGREPAAERHDGPPRAHRPHGRRHRHRRRSSRPRAERVAAPSIASTRPLTVGCASWPRPPRNSARCSRPWASSRSTTTSVRAIACRAAFAPLDTGDVVRRLREAGVAAVEPVGPNVHALHERSRRTARRAGRRAAAPATGQRPGARRPPAGERHRVHAAPAGARGSASTPTSSWPSSGVPRTRSPNSAPGVPSGEPSLASGRERPRERTTQVELELQGDQELFVETTRRFLEAESPLTEVRALYDDPVGFDRDFWRRGAELGWTTMLVPDRPRRWERQRRRPPRPRAGRRGDGPAGGAGPAPPRQRGRRHHRPVRHRRSSRRRSSPRWSTAPASRPGPSPSRREPGTPPASRSPPPRTAPTGCSRAPSRTCRTRASPTRGS